MYSAHNVLPGTGHLSPRKSPTEIAGIIREFVDGLERASGEAITVTLLMKVKEGRAEEFSSGLPALIRETSSSPGARSVRAFRNGESANAILFVEERESEEVFRKYIAWRTERGDMEKLGQMLSPPAEIATWSTATQALN